MTAPKPNYTYQVGASLPPNAPSYVRRQADTTFLQKLKAGKFCYVLNSRQMGKSSLRVRTMQQLQADGIVCAAIDLTGIGKHRVTLEQWYGGILYALVESCQLEDTFDWQEWWQKHQSLLSPVQCLSQFIEKVLLVEIQQPIVIFVDEIDRVLSQDFSLDDFFALIRYFQNQRVDNPKFERLTFALLGVATPSDLMSEKTQTPFNIGEGIELHGFLTGEVAPLMEGLNGQVSHPQAVMEEILNWTGGQPFLTQKLCQLVVEESERSDSVSVEQVVWSRIVENWESQDDPEHLRTIRDRILRDEQRAGYLLELYRQILQNGELAADNSIEQTELKLSGLVVQRQGKLRVYNRIYEAVFDLNWIERQLKNLRPYSEAFQAWIASGSTDESRLLRGKALQDAQEWSQDKSLSYRDKEFLAASEKKEIEEEIAAKDIEAQLERETKDREAVEQRTQVLAETNRQSKRRIQLGSAILALAVSGAVMAGILAVKRVAKADRQVDLANNKLEKAEVSLAQAEEEKQKAEAETQQAQEDLKTAQTEQESLERESQKKSEELEQAQNELISVGKQVEQVQQDASAARQEAEQANREKQAAEAETQQAQESLAQVRTERENLAQQSQDLRQEVQQQIDEREQVNRQLEQVQNQSQVLQGQLQNIQEEFLETQTEYQQAEADLRTIEEQSQNLARLSELSGELHQVGLSDEADEARRQIGLSYGIENPRLKQAVLLSGIAFAYQKLEKWQEAEVAIQESLEESEAEGGIETTEGKQVRVHVLNIQGGLLKEQDQSQQSLAVYTEAFDLFRSHRNQLNPFNPNIKILTANTVELIHRGLIDLLDQQPDEGLLLSEVRDSLKGHYLNQLDSILSGDNENKWREADDLTYRLMLFIARREREGWLNVESVENFPCDNLRAIDERWVVNSGGHFGFSVQRQILESTEWPPGDKLNPTYPTWIQFYEKIGWFVVSVDAPGDGGEDVEIRSLEVEEVVWSWEMWSRSSIDGVYAPGQFPVFGFRRVGIAPYIGPHWRMMWSLSHCEL